MVKGEQMLKKDAKTVRVKEQLIIDEEVSGLTLAFKAKQGGGLSLFIKGDNLPFKNRDFGFNVEGELIGRGTGLCEDCFKY